ncbi:MAG: hypothetical protein KC593_07920 [Myxococcales bacterium]|nr:hypothetical protein [Myxococcales bacterium]MCB9629642.1 hypothetical protein [Sandaracinaceae bacterium]
MPDRTKPTSPDRPSADPQPSLGSRIKEGFEQGVEAIVEAIGSLITPEQTPIPVAPGARGGLRRPPRRDHRFS